MKYFLMAVLVVVIGLVSCQKEITDEIIGTGIDTTIVPTTGHLEADIDSVHWTANDSVTANITLADTSLGLPGFITISATSTNGRKLNIGLIDSGVHIYSLYAIDSTIVSDATYNDSTSPAKGTFYTNDTMTGLKVGTVSIISIDTATKTLSGSFTFTVFRTADSSTRTFTNGTFTNVPYTKPNLPTATVTDSFTVKINDTLFDRRQVSSFTGGGDAAVAAADSLLNKIVDLQFQDTILAGSYMFDSLIRKAFYVTKATSSAPDSFFVKKNTGTFQVLEHNLISRRVRANFSFTAYRKGNPSDSAKFTEGYFSVELP